MPTGRDGFDHAPWFISIDIPRANIFIDCKICDVCREKQA